MTMKHPVPDNAVHPLTGLPLRYFLAAEIVADLPPYGGAVLLDGTLHCREDQYLRYRRWQSEALNEYCAPTWAEALEEWRAKQAERK